MATTVYRYPLMLEKMLDWSTGGSPTQPTGTLTMYAMLTSYTPSASDEFVDDISASVVASESLSGRTVTLGILDVANGAFPSLTGSEVGSITVAMDTGVESTSALLINLSGITGLPVTPNGTDLNIGWNASGVFGL
jgi:hypothetical protein